MDCATNPPLKSFTLSFAHHSFLSPILVAEPVEDYEISGLEALESLQSDATFRFGSDNGPEGETIEWRKSKGNHFSQRDKYCKHQ